MTGEYSWPHVKHAERTAYEKFHGDGLTAADHEKIREMCRSVYWNKKRYLYYRMIQYIPKAHLEYYFDGYTPERRRYHDLDPGTPFSCATATVRT